MFSIISKYNRLCTNFRFLQMVYQEILSHNLISDRGKGGRWSERFVTKSDIEAREVIQKWPVFGDVICSYWQAVEIISSPRKMVFIIIVVSYSDQINTLIHLEMCFVVESVLATIEKYIWKKEANNMVYQNPFSRYQ